MPTTYEPIATTTLGSDTATVSFSSISGSYTDLVAVVGNISATVGNTMYCRVGNSSVDTGSNYSYTEIFGNGSGASSTRASNTSNGLLCGDTTVGMPTGTSYATLIFNIQNYSNTTTYKTAISRYSSPSTVVQATAALWRSTSAINVIEFRIAPSGSFKSGSTFTLYGIKSA